MYQLLYIVGNEEQLLITGHKALCRWKQKQVKSDNVFNYRLGIFIIKPV
jgi:hypothetical protein